MVAKKQVLKELKKFNSDLDKHLPELNLDYLKNKDIFSSKEELNDVVPLLANNLMDLKTELALIRKNLTDSVEGMVLRLVSNQQQQFAAQMDRIFTQMLVEMKGNFSSYISEISSQINGLDKDLNQMKIENSKLMQKFDLFDSKLVELQSVIEDVKLVKKDFPKLLTQTIGPQLSNLKEEFESFRSDENKIRAELTNNFSKKFLEVSNKNLELSNSLKNFNPVEEDLIEIETNILKKPVKKLKKINLHSNERVERLISIEDRIRKLDSLK